MDWILIPFPLSLTEDSNSNLISRKGSNLISKNGQNVCLKRWIRIPHTTDSNPNSNKVCSDEWIQISFYEIRISLKKK